MASLVEEAVVEEKKKAGNECFAAGQFAQAADLYTEALALCTSITTKVIIYTNRAAAWIGEKKYEDALRDADAALGLDPTWLKAYYRKASALEGMNRLDLVYYAWLDALKHCEASQTLSKQHHQAEKKWLNQFRTNRYPVQSIHDLTSRFRLLSDQRERLSTLAHLWNESSAEERFAFFQLLLALIGGAGDLPEELVDSGVMQPSMMLAMPLDNYPDFPRLRLVAWMDFFRGLPLEEKVEAFRQIWTALTSKEQHEVIVDMRLFVAKVTGREDEILSRQAQAQADDEASIDFTYRAAFK